MGDQQEILGNEDDIDLNLYEEEVFIQDVHQDRGIISKRDMNKPSCSAVA